MKRLLILPLACVIAAGCGSKTGKTNLEQTTKQKSAATAVETFQLEVAKGAKRYNVSTLKATSTHVQLVLNNSSGQRHSLAIRGQGVDQKARGAGGKSNQIALTVELKPGTYTYYDPLDKALTGKLIVGAPS